MRQIRRQFRWLRDVLAGIGHRVRRRGRAGPAHAPAEDIERARSIVERSLWTYANLVYRRDKAVIFSDGGNAFLMYGHMHRTCVAMGDPVGRPEESRELISRFYELTRETRRRPVFFEVRGDNESIYRELGLTLTKLGEEARVELPALRHRYARTRRVEAGARACGARIARSRSSRGKAFPRSRRSCCGVRGMAYRKSDRRKRLFQRFVRRGLSQ